MRKTFLVALREFRERVTSRAFLLSALGTPLFVLVMVLATGGLDFTTMPEEAALEQLEELAEQRETVGYVDRADLIETIPDPVPADAFRAYPDTASARAALQTGEIVAYYVVPEDYRETGEIERVSPRFPAAPPDTASFDWVLVNNLYPEAGQERMRRLRWPFDQTGPAVVLIGKGEGEDGAEGEGAGNMTLPFIVTLGVMIPLFSGGSYLFQSLTNEKSNRVMEILLVSLRPRQLLTGKLLGLAALILVQYAIWLAIAGGAAAVFGQGLTQVFSGIQLTADEALLALLFALGGFGLYAALMAGIGALAEDVESGRGWIFVLTLPMMAPIYIWTVIANNPQGPVAVGLSLFPYSAPVAMLMRMTASVVPAWQLAVSLVLLAAAVVATIWLMARLFRAQTLLSGEPLSARRFVEALAGG
jgi:ABC-2 type transport system permease protein